MKKLIWGMVLGAAMMACQDSETESTDFTGNETVYPLVAGSSYDIDGTVTIQEKKDGSALIAVTLSGTDGDVQLPVHLHLGNIAAPGAEIYALLNPVTGKTGKSETLLNQVADETPITYKQLIALKACLKVHLAASGPDKDIVLAGGNIGAASADDSSTGRLGFGVCKSE
jgi:hypothetical protein